MDRQVPDSGWMPEKIEVTIVRRNGGRFDGLKMVGLLFDDEGGSMQHILMTTSGAQRMIKALRESIREARGI